MLSKILGVVIGSFMMFAMCNPFEGEKPRNIKDLDDNMIDLRLYHENLGDAIVHENQDIAIWLYDGLDSLLNVVADKFEDHRKLAKPFRETYEADLRPPIKTLGTALRDPNWEQARNAYTLLTKKCNNCHLDREVDKEVQNWLYRKR